MEPFYVIFLLPAFATGKDCLTWQFSTEGKLTLNVRLANVTTQSSNPYIEIFDNHCIKIATCSNLTCKLTKENENYAYQSELNQYSFIIGGHEPTDFDGTWHCFYGETGHIQTEISHNKGIIYDKMVNIEAEVLHITHDNKRFVHLKCSSCRIPYYQNAEFLVNNKTEDTVTFYPRNNLCYSSAEADVCNPERCTCSSAGNIFSRKFELTKKESFYSCDMIFKDEMSGAIFSQTASLYLNRTGIQVLPTATLVISLPTSTEMTDSIISSTYSETMNSESKGVNILIPIISVAVFCASMSVLLFSLCIKKRINKQKSKKRKDSIDSRLI